MAKYDIIYSCGHKGEITLFGKTSERERKIAWCENTGLCPECRKIETIKLADKLEKELDLPTVKGVSEKQIAYARSLRYKIANEYKEQIKTIKKERLECAECANITDEQIEKEAYKQPWSIIGAYYFCCVETNAGTIIDKLKESCFLLK